MKTLFTVLLALLFAAPAYAAGPTNNVRGVQSYTMAVSTSAVTTVVLGQTRPWGSLDVRVAGDDCYLRYGTNDTSTITNSFIIQMGSVMSFKPADEWTLGIQMMPVNSNGTVHVVGEVR